MLAVFGINEFFVCGGKKKKNLGIIIRPLITAGLYLKQASLETVDPFT